MRKGDVKVRIRLPILIVLLALALPACSTQGTFVVPKGTQLEVYQRPVTPDANGVVVTKPFFWTAAGVPPSGGVEYRLLKGDKVVKSGRLRAKFRVASIFWPPFVGVIVWPMGLNPNLTYDLVRGTQE
jgi:hypothetical protein